MGVFLEKGEILVELEIRLVPDAHIVGKPLATLDGSLRDKRQGHIPALGNQGDMAFRHFFEAHQVHVAVEIHHA